MKAFEIIQLLTKELVPVERCGTARFETSDMSELSQLFGHNYTWHGHMFKGNLFYVYNEFNDDWTVEDADIHGVALNDEHCDVFIYQVMEV